MINYLIGRQPDLTTVYFNDLNNKINKLSTTYLICDLKSPSSFQSSKLANSLLWWSLHPSSPLTCLLILAVCVPPRTANAQRVAFIIGGVAAILFSAVFLFTYCRSDTFPVVERIKGRITFWWQSISDHVCFCLCCKK